MQRIHYFALKGDIEGIARELSRGVSIELVDPEEGETPLGLAAYSSEASVETLRFILARGANVHSAADKDGRVPLWSALLGRDPEKVQVLMDAGANIQDCGCTLDYPLEMAFREGHFGMMQLLLKLGADLNQLDWTALMRAAALGTVADVKREISQGGDLAAQDEWERTPWILSLLDGDLAKIEFLAEISDTQAHGWCGKTALMYAVDSHNVEVLSWLIERGYDLNEKDEFARTALMKASEQGVTECVRRLLQAKADVDLASKRERTAEEVKADWMTMGLALPDDEFGFRDIFFEKMSRFEGQKAIEDAANLEIVRLLVDAGQDLNDMSDEMRAEMTGLETDGPIECFEEEYASGKRRRFSNSNPEVTEIPFWKAMVRSGATAWKARTEFGDTENVLANEGDEDEAQENLVEPGPVWCFEEGPTRRRPVWSFHRFGKSITELFDGRIIEIGGEHEDYNDYDFCIYNDVFVHHGGGRFDILGYPLEIFPPTDFHSATLVDEFIYIIGGLGYIDARISGETPVYRLDCHSLAIEKVETTGEKPGWISRHRAVREPSGEIRLWGGKVCIKIDGKEEYLSNTETFILDLANLQWRRVDKSEDGGISSGQNTIL